VKKYDPLWELAGQKRALVGMEEDVDGRCPVCHATLHVEKDTPDRASVECGLCGAELVLKLGDPVELAIASTEPLDEDAAPSEDVVGQEGHLGEPAVTDSVNDDL